jgi:hypothetical protein
MKLDPGIHRGMHLVCFLKPGVTAPHREAFMLKLGGRPEQASRAIIARRLQKNHFGAQMTSIAANHPAEAWY